MKEAERVSAEKVESALKAAHASAVADERASAATAGQEEAVKTAAEAQERAAKAVEEQHGAELARVAAEDKAREEEQERHTLEKEKAEVLARMATAAAEKVGGTKTTPFAPPHDCCSLTCSQYDLIST